MKGFVLAQDAVMMSLVSDAAYILESKDIDKIDKRVLAIARHVILYFVKKSKVKYTKARSIKVNEYLKSNIEPYIKEGTSSTLYLIIKLEYLTIENKHLETCKIFSTHISVIRELVNELETTSNVDVLRKHYRYFREGMLLGNPNVNGDCNSFTNKLQERIQYEKNI